MTIHHVSLPLNLFFNLPDINEARNDPQVQVLKC